MLSLQELRSSTLKELSEELKNVRRALLKSRIGVKTSQLKNTSLARKQKHYIAQIKTIIRELQLEEEIKNVNKIE